MSKGSTSTAAASQPATLPSDVANVPTGRAMWAMMAMMLGSNLLASFNQSLMNIALDQVATDFSVSLSVANWMVLGFTIVAATVITMAASLLKRFGIRKVMMFGYITSLVGSLLGFFAVNFPMMLAARLIQALTVGLFFPVVTSVILTISPAGKKGTMLAINSGVIGVGLAFAPMLAGMMLTYFGLRSLFLIPAVMSVVLIGLGTFFLHDIYKRQDRTIDALSVALSFLGLGAVIYGLNEISRDWLPSLIIMLVGVAIVALFAWRQFSIKTPLLNLAPLQHPKFVFGETLMMLGYMGSIYMSLLVPLYLEGTAGYTAFMAGCLLALPILCYAGSCFVGGRIEDKHGVWPLVPAGFLLLLVGFIGMEVTSSMLLTFAMMGCVALSYIGVGLVFPTLKAVDLGALPKEIYAHGSSIHSTLVQIAGSIGSALFVGIMSADADRLMATGATKAQAYAAGFSHTLYIDLGILAVAFIASIIFARLMRKKSN
ncbi:MAG: multidrug efflux MFS transporter [Eggerthellaceae bacterium]|nr:multidrug efflux MFS transporter [Eggerthellaceae bacterium]